MAEQTFVKIVADFLREPSLVTRDDFQAWCKAQMGVLTPAEAADVWQGF